MIVKSLQNRIELMTRPGIPADRHLAVFSRTHTDEEEDEYANTVVASASSVTNLSAAAPFGGKKSSGRKKSDTRKDSEMMNICVDCREMVLQVIRAQSTARRLQLAKSLFMSQA